MARRVANCPNCGALIHFRWSSAIQTTCEYCRSILVRHDVDLERVGEVADLPPDASPIQLGTAGVYHGRSFEVVGRILYEYEAGQWNEWHILYSNGASGWVSDAQADYAVTELSVNHKKLPASGELAPGQSFQWNGHEYRVTVKTRARYLGVEGELPFEYWDRHEVEFVDLRSRDRRFATIDYSGSDPLLFLGESVGFDELNLKNLRRFEGW
jgi:hypothetical protein